uniref:Uncharacterized protein n=1 Tax=Schistosoma haematobium TaxID=6185 RepID=A0A095CF89_SCHHA
MALMYRVVRNPQHLDKVVVRYVNKVHSDRNVFKHSYFFSKLWEFILMRLMKASPTESSRIYCDNLPHVLWVYFMNFIEKSLADYTSLCDDSKSGFITSLENSLLLAQSRLKHALPINLFDPRTACHKLFPTVLCTPLKKNTGSRIRILDTQDCFGLPENPFIIFGAVVSHTRAIGRTLCYFQPSEQNQYLSIYPTKLVLPSQFGTCPVIQIKEFTSVRDELIDNSDVNMIIPMKVPDDTKLIFQANCTNYPSMLDKVVHTSSSNLKIQILFDPANSAASDVAYQFVISSYGNLNYFVIYLHNRVCESIIN